MIQGKNPFASKMNGRGVVEGISDESVERMDKAVNGTGSRSTAFESGNPDFADSRDCPQARGGFFPKDAVGGNS